MFIFGVILVVLGTVLVTYDTVQTRFYNWGVFYFGVVLVVAGLIALTSILF